MSDMYSKNGGFGLIFRGGCLGNGTFQYLLNTGADCLQSKMQPSSLWFCVSGFACGERIPNVFSPSLCLFAYPLPLSLLDCSCLSFCCC